jgi:sec-independent protein translocase protein TatA
MNIGLPELLILLFVVLLVLGPKRLPALGRSLGGGLREFKDSISSKGKDDTSELTAADTDTERPALDGEVVPESRR